MTQIVINRVHGGFGLSDQAIELYFDRKGWEHVTHISKFGQMLHYKDSVSDENFFSEHELQRDDPDLVFVVKKLGEFVNTKFSHLKIVTIPDDVDWFIEEYDGVEWVAEKHRTWC